MRNCHPNHYLSLYNVVEFFCNPSGLFNQDFLANISYIELLQILPRQYSAAPCYPASSAHLCVPVATKTGLAFYRSKALRISSSGHLTTLFVPDHFEPVQFYRLASLNASLATGNIDLLRYGIDPLQVRQQ